MSPRAALARVRRRTERWWARAGYHAARALWPTRVPPGPVRGDALRRVLVLPNYKVGDLAVATPAIAYLRDAAPHARLDVLVSPRTASLLAGDPRVDRVLVHDPAAGRWRALARRLRRERYDLVVDLVLPKHRREGLLVARAAGPEGARVTPHRPPAFAGFFTHRPRTPGAHRRHMADRMLHTVRSAVTGGGAAYPMTLAAHAAADARACAFLAEHAPGPFVAFNAWGSDHTRTLDVAQAAAVLGALAARHPGLVFVLTPPPGATPDPRAVAAAARAALGDAGGDAGGAQLGDAPGTAGRIAVFPPDPDLRGLVALLRRAALVVSPDTGTVHLAAAVGGPVVALYTTVATPQPSQWTPHGVPHRAVVVEAPRLVRDAAPAAVVAAFESLWNEIAGAGAAAARGVEAPEAGPATR